MHTKHGHRAWKGQLANSTWRNHKLCGSSTTPPMIVMDRQCEHPHAAGEKNTEMHGPIRWPLRYVQRTWHGGNPKGNQVRWILKCELW
mmetsp:Transcript_49167/g.124771  ORF Transcript_49167/g.124771 Transcript_49167/m.124771 type:complete len:88 (-) Transcript_49167:313-576(-)